MPREHLSVYSRDENEELSKVSVCRCSSGTFRIAGLRRFVHFERGRVRASGRS